jgi:hypothetical protein
MRHVPYFLGLSFGVIALGCSSSTVDTTVIVRPELVAVSPDDFLGALKSAEASQVQSYVATLFDVSPEADGDVPDPGFQLASSPATSYLLPVAFSFVITSHRYLAQVEVYDRAPQSGAADAKTDASDKLNIVPSSDGGRLQFDTSGALVTPLAHITCGGYPASPGDGGSFGGAGSLGAEEVLEAGAAGTAGAARTETIQLPPGILTYDGITQTAHNCIKVPVTN